MRNQLGHLLDVARLPNVALRVLAFKSGARPASPGVFAILDFANPDMPDVVCIEQLRSNLYPEGDEQHAYMVAYPKLEAAALSQRESAKLISNLMRTL